MRIKELVHRASAGGAKISGEVPRKLWVRLGLALLVALTICTWGCDDSYPGLMKQELVSDPLPDFDDTVLAGEWLMNGRLVEFAVTDHGEYLIPLGPASHDDSDNPTPTKLKRVGDTLFLEYVFDFETFKAYRPCRVDVKELSLELHCFVANHLEEMGFMFEVHGDGDDQVKVVNADSDKLRELFLTHAQDPAIFSREFRYTRPQPVRMSRLRKKAIEGSAIAQEELAKAYNDGEIVERDMEEALLWAGKAARSGRPSAEVLFGDLLKDKARRTYDQTKTTAIDDEARYWYERAAEQNYGQAYYKLGALYELGSETDKLYAIECYRRGMELGDADSQETLGNYYFMGRTVARDEHLALSYLEGVPEGSRGAFTWMNLARLYLAADDPDMRDAKRALAAAERALQEYKSCETEELFAKASFENELYESAVEHQKRALCPNMEGADKRKATLVEYQNYLPGGAGESN